MTKVLLWWNGLTLIQCRQPSNKDQLVERTENAIISLYEHMANATSDFSKKFAAAVEDSAAKREEGSSSSVQTLPTLSSVEAKKFS